MLTHGREVISVIDVYGRQSWYLAQPEPEQELVGMLEAVRTISGPGNRPSLTFLLRTADGDLPVYAARVGDLLGSLVGPALRIRGKIVDLTTEGGTEEVWIATIEPPGGSHHGSGSHASD